MLVRLTDVYFGFDYVCIDEAHACKKVFTNVVGTEYYIYGLDN